jgi:hypothetical protein
MDISAKKAKSLDHVLVTVKNYLLAYENYKKLGFQVTPISYHPWGTATSFLVFQGNFIELIGVDDDSKFGTNAVNGFCFGRKIGEFLSKGEDGVSLIALHSKDAINDYAEMSRHHDEHQGIIDFRRPILLEDGTPDEVVVTIGLLLDSQYSEASSFICHQHRPDLIWKDEWMVHSNGATKIEAITYLADDLSILQSRWNKDYDNVEVVDESLVQVDTDSGLFKAMLPSVFAEIYRDIDQPISSNPNPHVGAITISTNTLEALIEILEKNQVPYFKDEQRVLVSPTFTGNVIMEFVRL